MSDISAKSETIDSMSARAEPDHIMGPVSSDWEAAEVCLRAVARKSRNGSVATVTTYRHHLAKLRWYCENVARVTPSRWSIQDVDRFKQFLTNVPVDALCRREGNEHARANESGYTPFRTQPAPSSRADIERFVHAMFKTWNAMGYIRINPMALERVSARRAINPGRSVDLDVLEVLLATVEREIDGPSVSCLTALRDRFILIALRELGLRANELVGATMGSFYRLADPKSRQRYWIFKVDAATAKGGRERRIPVTVALLKALQDYRMGFRLPPNPSDLEAGALLLSPYTRTVTVGGVVVRSARSKRFFGEFKELTTRQHLYSIVKRRLKSVAACYAADGEHETARQLEIASPHWLRHTFAKAALLQGQSMREVASMLGHASVDTTMVYTNQDAIDLVRSYERENIELARAD